MSTRRQALDDALARLARLHPQKIDLSLGRLQRLLAALGSPQDNLPPTIHVAGTNGKGSICAFLAEMARAKGERVHIYTSPHLVNFNERILLDSKPADDHTLIEAFARCEAANFGEPITFFEITTAAAFLLFSEHPADRLILEVGMGGRLDATNVIARPALSVITPVSLDHQEFLGRELADIARIKAGICKFGVPTVVANQCAVSEAAILDEAQKVGAPTYVWGRDYNAYMQHGRLVFENETQVWDLPAPGLLGPHQVLNAGAAAACAAVLQWPEEAVAKGIGDARWPGRLQRLTSGPIGDLARQADAELWLDSGHNEAAAKALSHALADMDERDDRPLVIIAGFSPDKDVEAWCSQFSGLARRLIAVEFKSGRGGSRLASDVAAASARTGLEATTAAGLIA
ncbi:folylpolyglutamate synthase/dihydrofolate synthase family protein, partial [uncultured Maricaulis sp.]|uniref:bifunctional folylpolyglutamate synthase/dihydrofolate synthase n=1 Tax=uncultured Maricaulis sp. TaxID=174710 RepID=UPI0030D94909